MNKTIRLTLCALGIFGGMTASYGATSLEVKVSTSGSVTATTSGETSAQFAHSDGTVTEIASLSTYSSDTGLVTPVEPNDPFAGTAVAKTTDARSEEGKAIAASSAQPSQGSPSDVATAAGEESTAAGTETAAGSDQNANTQAPAPPVVNSGSTPSTATPGATPETR